MTEPQRYLTRVFMFLGAVLVVAVVLMGPISRAFLSNPALNGLIIATLLIGLILSIRQMLALKVEVKWIEEFRRADSIAGVSTTPRLLAPMAAMLGDSKEMSLSALSMRTLLDGISARMDEGREISRYVIGLLVFLGLLGTFWGLLNTITAISDTIRSLSVESSDIVAMFDSLKGGLQKPLSGMGTAFSSSLFGLSGSVILGFVDLQAGQAQNRFFNDLEDWLSTVTKLGRGGGVNVEGDGSVPSYVAALLEQTAESLDKLQRLMARGEDDETRACLRSIDATLKALAEDAAKGRALMADEVRSEIKLLARTLSAALDNPTRRPRNTQATNDDDSA